MSEPAPQYTAAVSTPAPGEAFPRRALNLARRVLQLERECRGRGRIEIQVIMLDGEWLLTVSQPGPIERLGNG